MFVARNKNGLLRCSIFKPTKPLFGDAWIWRGTKAQVMNLPKEMFPELKWEDEPIEVNFIRSDEYDLYQAKRELEDALIIGNIEKGNYKTIS